MLLIKHSRLSSTSDSKGRKFVDRFSFPFFRSRSTTLIERFDLEPLSANRDNGIASAERRRGCALDREISPRRGRSIYNPLRASRGCYSRRYRRGHLAFSNSSRRQQRREPLFLSNEETRGADSSLAPIPRRAPNMSRNKRRAFSWRRISLFPPRSW